MAHEIKNYLYVDERIATGGQPTDEQLRVLAASGHGAVINLGLLDPKYCLADEAGLVTALGMQYRHIPISFDAPALRDFRDFLQAMDDWAEQRVFVHCAANYRVSSCMAVYAEKRLGWSRERADQHACRLWEPNDVWRAFLRDCRALFIDAAAV